MKRSILGVVTALVVAVATEVSAGGIITSKVAEFGLIASTNIGWVRVVGPVTTQASCATPNYFVVNLATESGRWVFRVLLAAQVQGLPVTIYGTGQCTQASGSEDILYIWYNPPI